MSIEQIKKLLKTNSLVLGTDNTLKALKNKELVKVFLAQNAPEKMAEDVGYYASIAGAEVEKLDVPNDELGVICKKPFAIACIGMKKVVEKKKY